MPTRPSGLINGDADLEAAGRRSLGRGAALIGGTATTKYMRTGGTNVGANNQTGPGSLRRQTGRLARSLTGARSMNERVNVHTHTRQQTHFFGEELDSPITVRVHAHSRMMNLPERPYLGPALEDTEGEIVDIIEEEVIQELFN